MKVTFMQPLGGIKKADAEQDVIHLNQSRAVWVGCLDSIYYAVAIGECGFSLSVSHFFSIFAAVRKLYIYCEQSKQ